MVTQEVPFALRYLRANEGGVPWPFDLPFMVRYRTLNGMMFSDVYDAVNGGKW